MKKAIFIFLFLISISAQASGIDLGIMATSSTGDKFVTSPGSFVASLDYGNKIVVGVDVMPDGPQTARIGWNTGRSLLSIGIGRQVANVNHETVGSIVYDSVSTNLNLVFVEYKRGVFVGRVGNRYGGLTQPGLDGGVTPVDRDLSTSGAFMSLGVRVALGR